MNINNMLNQYNLGSVFEYDRDVERVYVSLEELITKFGKDKVYPVHAFFVNTKSLFGDAPVVYSGEYIVNLPQHLLKATTDMTANELIVIAINERKVGFVIETYDRNEITRYSVRWVEI